MPVAEVGDFEGRAIPAGDITPALLDAIATFVPPRGDESDHRSLDWVPRLVDAHPEARPRVTASLASLLRHDDPGVVADVLDQVTSFPEMAADLMALVCDHGDSLRARFGPYCTTPNLLGLVVRALAWMLRPPAVPTPAATRVLATLTDRADGWPTSFVLAWAGDPAGLAPRVPGEVERMDDADAAEFWQDVARAGIQGAAAAAPDRP